MRCAWLAAFAMSILLGLAPSHLAAQIATGVYWNPNEPGRGYAVEISSGRVLLGVFAYRSSGTAAWYVSTGGTFTPTFYFGNLVEYANGQTLAGAYRAPSVSAIVGEVNLTLGSGNQGTVQLPGTSGTSIQRFDIVGSGVTLGRPQGAPETGWWWNASESGRGYFIEVQGGRLLFLTNMYETDGSSRWYTATGDLSLGPFGGNVAMTATLEEYGGGQTLSGSFARASRTATKGSITLSFTSSTAGTLTLPNGTQVAISRFAF
jgi:hypothetical protein